MPFLRLTRDRRGIENTFLLHADHPGDRPRLLYWYRTAPDIVLGRPPLDEEAIRTIEEEHPEIDFDWPAILALGEAMIHEDEAPARPERGDRRGRGPRRGRDTARSAPDEVRAAAPPEAVEPLDRSDETLEPADAADQPEPSDEPPHPTMHGLLEQLVGREVATRLRARHSEICARIHERHQDEAMREMFLHRAEAIDPDTWLTPEAVLDGVRKADQIFSQLRHELHPPTRE